MCLVELSWTSILVLLGTRYVSTGKFCHMPTEVRQFLKGCVFLVNMDIEARIS